MSRRLTEFYQDRPVLVTGAAGFVGSALVGRLSELGARVRRQSRRPFTPRDDVEDVIGELQDQDFCDRLMDGIDVVMHCAAQTSVYQAEADPVADLMTNAGAPIRLLEAARKHGRKPSLVLASTATTAGLPEQLPVTFDTPPRPVTAYDTGKLAAEAYLALYVRLGHVRGGALRLANVYGPGVGSSAADRGILNKVLKRALDGAGITLFGDGDWVRDYVYITDVVEAFVMAGAAGAALDGAGYLVCSGEGHTVAEAFGLAAEVARALTGRAATMTATPPPSNLSPIEFRNFVGEWEALARATGWRPRIGLRQGLELTARAFLAAES
ncbi:hypothetical protein A6A04_12085 [Paramagnetospirillum marisnigri]|uniref:NAD-dependent epimerase/dehydratase domain-containing protein n=1 Tax=Paramagnetospirillum marisnigri TaxID=1285242 RepID=A0A178MVT6_9PROT|nr:NAD-dependent epimerase/dehydratase family protein [Paramagnetospirillum marisnigri]OAN54657.1 hypothetical protein A6A04_12085 [Paramagnetospirillum marisnigri]